MLDDASDTAPVTVVKRLRKRNLPLEEPAPEQDVDLATVLVSEPVCAELSPFC